MGSLERAKSFQSVLEVALEKAGIADNNLNIQRLRFRNRLEEAIESDPQLLRTDGWLCHHAINTLMMSAEKIAEKCGMSKSELISEWNKTATV